MQDRRGRREMWFCSTYCILVNAQSIVHIVFQLYDILRFDSTVVINLLINISSPKINNQVFYNFEAECINMLLG